MTDFRADGTIMGPAGLTAVFGDGNGCGPAGMVAGKAAGGRRGPAGRESIRRHRRIRIRCANRRRKPPATGPFRAGRVSGRWRGGLGVTRNRAVPRLRMGRGIESGWSSRSAVRTGRLRPSRAVHARPIDLVISQEPSGQSRPWKPRLGGGFALRCLQRLSFPDLATRRCPERDSRHTRGRSSPILSY